MEPMTYATPDGLDLDLRVPAGTITVRADETEETRVSVTGEQNPEDVIVRLTPRPAGGHHLVVEHRPQRGFGGFGRQTELEVQIDLPRGSELRCAGGSADLVVTGELASLSHRSGSGDLAFGEVRGSVLAKVGSGDIQGGSVHGDLNIQSASGDIRIEQVRGSGSVKTASGDTEIGRTEGSFQVASASGDVAIRAAAKGSIQVRTVSGDITVGVVTGTRVWLDLASISGDARSELESAVAGADSGLEIRASSVSGEVRVARAEAGVAC